jgi:hypothetical protein
VLHCAYAVLVYRRRLSVWLLVSSYFLLPYAYLLANLSLVLYQCFM